MGPLNLKQDVAHAILSVLGSLNVKTSLFVIIDKNSLIGFYLGKVVRDKWGNDAQISGTFYL